MLSPDAPGAGLAPLSGAAGAGVPVYWNLKRAPLSNETVAVVMPGVVTLPMVRMQGLLPGAGVPPLLMVTVLRDSRVCAGMIVPMPLSVPPLFTVTRLPPVPLT